MSYEAIVFTMEGELVVGGRYGCLERQICLPRKGLCVVEGDLVAMRDEYGPVRGRCVCRERPTGLSCARRVCAVIGDLVP